jgi:ketosteroid isomerase-like protein
MSEENVELARKTYAILNEVYLTGDPEPLRRHIQERAAPECVLITTDITFESEWRGAEGILAFVADQMEALDRMWIRPDDYVDLGDRVIILLSWGGRAKQTGIEVEFSSAHVFTFRDGLAVRIHMYRDPVYGVNAESLRAFWDAWKPGEELPTFIFDSEVATRTRTCRTARRSWSESSAPATASSRFTTSRTRARSPTSGRSATGR